MRRRREKDPLVGVTRRPLAHAIDSPRSEYKQILKQRKTGPFDELMSPDGSQYLSKACRSLDEPSLSLAVLDNDECSSDESDNSQKGLVFAE